MESQNKIDDKFYVARNYRVIREFRAKTQDEVVKAMEKTLPENDAIKQNVSAWELAKGNPGKKFIDLLSHILSVPTEVFYIKGLTKEYLEMHFSGKKPTQDDKPGDNNGKEVSSELRDLIERNERYQLMPTVFLDKYELLSKEERESRDNAFQELSITMKIAIEAKDKLIRRLEREIEELQEKLKVSTAPQQTQ